MAAPDRYARPVTIATPLSAAYPVVDGPRPFFVTGSTIGSTTPVKLTWCGLTTGTTIKSYRLYQSRNGGAFTTPISATTATSSTRTLSVSPTTYLFKARVLDRKNRIAYGAGPRFRVVRYLGQRLARVLTAVHRQVDQLLGWGGAYTKSAASPRVHLHGRSFAIACQERDARLLQRVRGRCQGHATAVSTRSSRTQYRRVLYQRSMPFGAHTVKIVAVGNGRIDIDAILTIAAS